MNDGQETTLFQCCWVIHVRLEVSLFCCLHMSLTDWMLKKSADLPAQQRDYVISSPSRKIQKSSSMRHIPRETVQRAGESQTHGIGQMKTNPWQRKVQCCGLCFRAKVNQGKFKKATRSQWSQSSEQRSSQLEHSREALPCIVYQWEQNSSLDNDTVSSRLGWIMSFKAWSIILKYVK